MFSLFKTLNARKKVVDLSGYVRRICDLTVPNRLVEGEPSREGDRYNRTLPVLLAPWQHTRPVVQQSCFATTRDLSDGGVSVVTSQPLTGELVVGFWLELDEWTEPWFFLGEVIRSTPIGGGFWVTGIRFTELATADYRQQLEALLPQAHGLRSGK